MRKPNYDKFPVVPVKGHQCVTDWAGISQAISSSLHFSAKNAVIVVECYHGVDSAFIREKLVASLAPQHIIETSECMLGEEQINDMVDPYVTDDPVFGYIAPLQLTDFFDSARVEAVRNAIGSVDSGLILVIGIGATLIAPEHDLLIYADMPRWEIQMRFRAKKVGNMGIDNRLAEVSYKYKRSFFVDWKVCDRHKQSLIPQWDYILDTTSKVPKMISAAAWTDGLDTVSSRPFRVVPFFDPGPWGGQWLKEVCELDRNVQNYAWAFDCVPEENSLRLGFGDVTFEMPSINLIYARPIEVLGNTVFQHFGHEFPIRFDILDTMQGGNLSLQVHPHLAYIREKFGMNYTQEESYYFLEAEEGSIMYLGFKENVDKDKMIKQLSLVQQEGGDFPAERYVETIPVKKHDHVLIPTGTIHCSGANSVVLEISATPFNFTFKLWDWGRMGLDGKPRPISLEHGEKVLEWGRTSGWTNENLVNQVSLLSEDDDCREEKTGLYAGSFIETRRYYFDKGMNIQSHGVVNVLNLVEGEEIIIESKQDDFEPYIIHYAETFIVPASVSEYTVRPHGRSEGKECIIIKAFVQIENLANYTQN